MSDFKQTLAKLSEIDGVEALRDMRRGIEREALRVNSAGELATDAHPKVLGSALTHSKITTDYSESLLEFITPVFKDIDALIEDLTYTHAFTVQNIEQQLWPTSMPCNVTDADKIPVAQYGNSHSGMMKTLYRKGLTYRYGAPMQIISGVHYNVSISASLWQKLYQLNDGAIDGVQMSMNDFISESYFGLIRNYRRLVWVLPYLFGASPALCRSFVQHQESDIQFDTLAEGTLYLPYATSLRMSDLGYTNKEQEQLNISYNSLSQYLEGMKEAIRMPSTNFEKIGVKVGGELRQLNGNILQIENELYSPIRPKRVALAEEKPSEALARGGVEYIEVRALDVNPFSAIGIDRSQIQFIDLLLLYCLLADSPKSTKADEQELSANLDRVVLEGRKPNLTLSRNGKDVSLSVWLNELFDDLKLIAELLDGSKIGENAAVLAKWRKAIDLPELTLSGQVITELKHAAKGHCCWSNILSSKYYQQLQQVQIPKEVVERYQQESEHSLQLQSLLEQRSEGSFEQFLARYFSDIDNVSFTELTS